MTTTLRAHVYRDPIDRPADALGPWNAAVPDPARPRTIHLRWARSWPEAMQQAYKLLHDLDQQLMEQVHESRASRRATPDLITTKEPTA